MNKAFMGLCHTGNFAIPSEIKNEKLDDKKLIKKDGGLFVVIANNEYELTPLDNEAIYITSQFSDYPTDENDSVYELMENKNILVVMLYVFRNCRRRKSEKETMYYYMDRLLKNKLIEDGDIQGDDEIKFLNDEFIINKSTFVIEYFGGQATKTFQMYGNKYVASVEIERPGVFKVKSVRPYKVNNRAEELVQLYDLVKFVSFEDSLQIKNAEIVQSNIKTNQIFDAWKAFLDFEEALFDDEVKKLGFVKYTKVEYDDEHVKFYFDKMLNETALFSDMENANNRTYDVIINNTENEFDNIDDIIRYRDSQRHTTIYLGKCLNENYHTNELVFECPDISYDFPDKSCILLSNKNMKIEKNRRENVARIIDSRTSTTSNMIMRLSAGEEDFQRGSNIEPVTGDVLKKTFGDATFNPGENFRKAMDIAINTPDIALIQGPPGTGKTTLINAIVKRLTSRGNSNFKILVSSEQHEAVRNVVDKLSQNAIPPFTTSHRHVDDKDAQLEDEQKMMHNVEKFQKEVLDICDDILAQDNAKNSYSSELAKIVYSVNIIRASNYDTNIIQNELPNIIKTLVVMDCYQYTEDIIDKISNKISLKSECDMDEREGMDTIKARFNSQRLDMDAFFNDDGIRQLERLQRSIRTYGYNYLLIDDDLFNDLKKGDQNKFKIYLEYISKIKQEIEPDVNEFELETLSYKQLFDALMTEVRKYSMYRTKNIYDIIEAFKFSMADVDNVRDVIRKYTNVIGSTCAQAQRSTKVVNLNESGKYDYVIIDEAARANPLDLMIPILLGIKVIMVGDQMQLPHYIETDYQKKFKAEQEKYGHFDDTLLTKSLFEVLYEALEQSWKDGKLKFQRHIRIGKQHRMHPIIGNFISKEFYEKDGKDGIENGDATASKINDYGIYNGANIVWEDIPITSGLESRNGASLYRVAEAEKVISILQNIIRKNNGKHLSIGIISFYKGQVELINSLLKEKFDAHTLEQVECNTVDSYQGKEFDIVILSTTRSNAERLGNKSLGFIFYSKSRINVALSRARKLLIVVGDADTMSKSDSFSHFIDYVKDNGYYGG